MIQIAFAWGDIMIFYLPPLSSSPLLLVQK